MAMSHVTIVPSTLPGGGCRAEDPRAGRLD